MDGDMDFFFVELVSNASMETYPQNTLSHFTNFLPEPINFKGEWQVALAEMSTPADILNVSNGVFGTSGEIDRTGDGPYGRTAKIHEIKPGLYKSVEDIINAMTQAMRRDYGHDNYVFPATVDDITGTLTVGELPSTPPFSISFNQPYVNYKPSHEIPSILGFNPADEVLLNGRMEGRYATDILAGRHNIHVYTDIIHHGIIGDRKAAILRTVPIVSKMRSSGLSCAQTSNYHSFQEPLQFKTLQQRNIHSINVELRDSFGEFIPFKDNGRTTLTLMFKKVPPSPQHPV